MGAALARVGDTIQLGPEPQTFALKFTTGKSVASRFPGGRVMFTLIGDRKLFLNDEEASEFEHAMIEQRIQICDFMKVSRVTHGRGGGFSIRVERVPDESDAPAWVREPEPTRTAPRTRLEAQLEGSLLLGRPAAASAPAETAPRQEKNGSDPAVPASHRSNGTAAPRITPQSAKLCGIMCTLIDAMKEGAVYAERLELGISPECLRALAITAYIQLAKEGGR